MVSWNFAFPFAIFGSIRCLREVGLCYCVYPGKDKDKLSRKMKNLKCQRDDIEERANRDEATYPRSIRKPEVTSWMRRVDSLDGRVKGHLDSLAERKSWKSCLYFWRCPCKDYKLGKDVADALDEIKELGKQSNKFWESVVDVDPEQNVEILEKKKATLIATKKDLIEKVRLKELRGGKRTSVVENWILDVESVEKRVNELPRNAGSANRSQASSSNQQSHANNHQQFYRDVVRLLDEVCQLIGRRYNLGDLVNQALPYAVEDVEISSTFMVGREVMMTNQRHLWNDETVSSGQRDMDGIGNGRRYIRVPS